MINDFVVVFLIEKMVFLCTKLDFSIFSILYLSIHYASLDVVWNQNEIIVDDAFAFVIATEILISYTSALILFVMLM